MFETLKRFIKDAVVLYPILVLFLIIWTIKLGLPLLLTLTCVVFWILSIPIVNWIVDECIKTSKTKQGNTDDETVDN